MNLLITGAVSWQKDFFETLRNMGHDIRFIQDERIPLGEYDVEYGWVEGIIGNGCSSSCSCSEESTSL